MVMSHASQLFFLTFPEEHEEEDTHAKAPKDPAPPPLPFLPRAENATSAGEVWVPVPLSENNPRFQPEFISKKWRYTAGGVPSPQV